MVTLKANRINIIELGQGDRISKWPQKIRNHVQLVCEGPQTIKILVSNVNKHDMFLEVYSADSCTLHKIGIADLLYKPCNLRNSLIFKRSAKSTKPILKEDYDRKNK